MRIYIFDNDYSSGKSSDRRAYEIGYAIGKVIRFVLLAGASFCVTKAVMFVVALIF